MAREKNIRIACDDAEEHPVHADRSMSEVILQNIVTNAVKYSPPDSTVSVGCATNGEGTVCSITDTGSGIPAEQLSRIFDRFYRSDESRNAAVSGSGLGLAIVKRLADLQHLRISVRSEQGTTFSVIFPS
jgi:two-component system, OmpR family, heavy metal sensor histidine kinase CusS